MGRMLVGYDGSPGAQRALDRASELAKQCGATLVILTAAADRLPVPGQLLHPAADPERGRRIAEAGAGRARGAGVLEVEARTSLEAPADALVLESSHGYEVVVLGHRSSGALAELFLGSTAKAVVDHARCSVLVVRG